MSEQVAQLLAPIFAEPRLDEHRQVYADWLVARGDPRGEFINLQLAEHRGEASEATRARAQALLRAHEKAWLGPLVRLLDRKSVVFERGFPVRARFKPGLRKPERLFGEASWATFEHLEDPPLGLLHHPNTRSLRSISLHRVSARSLLQDPRPLTKIEELEVRASANEGTVIFGVERELYESTTSLPGLTALRMLHFQVGSPWFWLWNGTLGRKLRSFALVSDGRAGPGPAGYWARDMREAGTRLDRVSLADPFIEVALGHVEAQDWARAEVRCLCDAGWEPRLASQLTHLAELGITRVKVEPEVISDHPTLREALETCSRSGCAVVSDAAAAGAGTA